jgi:hypothetical protein
MFEARLASVQAGDVGGHFWSREVYILNTSLHRELLLFQVFHTTPTKVSDFIYHFGLSLFMLHTSSGVTHVLILTYLNKLI